MEHWNKITCASALLAVAILMASSIEMSAGFFLNNNPSETTSAEQHVSLTSPYPVVSKDAIRIDEVPTQQVINSVKGIVSLVLDEHKADNQTQPKSSEENNEIELKLRNITPDTSNDIQDREEHNPNLIRDSNDPSLSIVKIPDADTEDIATALEDTIRSSVNEEIQSEQTNESSAIDVIEDIPELEVRQKLTEDLMAIEYPQTVRRDEENSEASATKEENKIHLTETAAQESTEVLPIGVSLVSNQTEVLPIAVTLASSQTEVLPIGITLASNQTEVLPTGVTLASNQTVAAITNYTNVGNAAFVDGATTEFASDAELTTPAIAYFQEITMIPTEEIVYSFEGSNLSAELNSARSRQMRGFMKQSETNEIEKESHRTIFENSSDSPSHGSQVNSKSELSKEFDGTEQLIPQDIANMETSTASPYMTTERMALEKVTPTRRPSVGTTSALPLATAEIFTSDSTDAIILDEITESTGRILSEVVVPLGDGDHTIIKKPGVEAELPALNATAMPMEGSSVNLIEDLQLRTNIDPIASHLLKVSTEGVDVIPIITEASITVKESLGMQTLNNSLLLKTEDPIIHSESRVVEKEVKSIDMDRFEDAVTSTTEHEPNQAIIKEVHFNNNLSFSAAEQIETGGTFDEQTNKDSPHLPSLHEEHHESSTEASNRNASKEFEDTAKQSKHQRLTEKTTENVYELHAFPTSEHVMSPKAPLADVMSQDPTSKEIPADENINDSITHHQEVITPETSTENPIGRSSDDVTSPALVRTIIEAAELTTEFARHVESFRTTRDEAFAFSDKIVLPAATGRSFNAIVAEGLGKPLPTRSVGDEPSTSSYSSEDKTTTLVVLCTSAAVIFVSFSIAMYLITFQRQHGTLDIEMQEQRCGKDDLEEDEDAETRVTLLNQLPPVDSDEHSFD